MIDSINEYEKDCKKKFLLRCQDIINSNKEMAKIGQEFLNKNIMHLHDDSNDKVINLYNI